MSKVISSSMLLLLICASLSFAEIEDENEVRMIPISRKMADAEQAQNPASTSETEAPSEDAPIPCGESEVIKNLNEQVSLTPNCFEITPKGNVTFNKTSERFVKFEQKSSIVKLVCKAEDDPDEKKTYLFLMSKNRLSKVVLNSKIEAQLNYDGNGQCFDITHTKQAAKPMPKMRVPASETK